MDPAEFCAQYGVDNDKTQQLLSLTPEQQIAVIAKGSMGTARDPTAVIATRIKQVTGHSTSTITTFQGNSNVLGGKNAVLVRGFDFGTTDEQISMHCAAVGTVIKVQQVGQGAAVVKYSSAAEAKVATQTLQDSTIA